MKVVRPMLHFSKKTAVVSWLTNIGYEISSLKDLKDGEILSHMVLTLNNTLKENDNSIIDEQPVSENNIPLQTELITKKENIVEEGHINSAIDDGTDYLNDSDKIKSEVQNDLSASNLHDEHSRESEKTELGEFAIDEGDSISAEEKPVDDSIPVNNEVKVSNNESEQLNSDAQHMDVDHQTQSVDNSALNDIQTICHNISLDNENKLQAGPSVVESCDNENKLQAGPSVVESCDNEDRYIVIIKFIENMLDVNCKDLVNIKKCKEGGELDLSKLTLLLLCAIIQYSLSVNSNVFLRHCYNLQSQDQEEIMDCLQLFLTERTEAIDLNEFNARMKRSVCKSRRSSPRGPGAQIMLFNTPKNKKKSHKKKKITEEVFQSPIQNFINSENIRMTPNSEARLLDAIRTKDKTIALLSYDLDTEKEQVYDHQKEIGDLKYQISRLKKELEKVKQELTESTEELSNEKIESENMKKYYESDNKSLKDKIIEMEKVIKFLREDSLQENDSEHVQLKKEKLEVPAKEEPQEEEEEIAVGDQVPMDVYKLTYIELEQETKRLHERIELQDIDIRELMLDKERIMLSLQNKDEEIQRLKAELEKKTSNAETKVSSPTPDNAIQTTECDVVSEISMDCENASSRTEEAETVLPPSSPPNLESEFSHTPVIVDVVDADIQTDLSSTDLPFVICDWTARDRVQEKYDQLEQVLEKEREEFLQLQENNQALQQELDVKVQEEKEWSNRLRTADRRREQEVKINRNLQRENDMLKGQIDGLKAAIQTGNFSGLNDKSPASSERRLRNLRRSSESVGHLWQSSHFDNSFVDSPSPSLCVESSHPMKETCEKSTSIGDHGDVICSEVQFNQIKELVQNLSKLIREKNNQTGDILSNLQSFEVSFDSMTHLVGFLSLISEITKDLLNLCSSSKHKQSSSHSSKTIEEPHELFEKEYERLKNKLQTEYELTKNLSEEKIEQLNNKVLQLEGQLQKEKNCFAKYILEHSHANEKLKASVENLKVQLTLSEEKLKDSEQKVEKYNKELSLAERKNESISERFKRATDEVERLKQKIATLKDTCEDKILKVKLKQNPLAPAICEDCLKLKDTILAYKADKAGSKRIMEALKRDIDIHKREIIKLCKQIEKERQEKSNIEKELDHERARFSASCSNRLQILNEHMRAREERERKEREALQTSNISKEDEDRNLVASITGDYSFCQPRSKSSANFARSNSKSKFNAFCKVEDEADILSQSSIAERRASPEERMKELQRRNSLCPSQMKSVYALELNMTPSQSKYFQPPTPVPSTSAANQGSSQSLAPHSKKRKLSSSVSTTSLSSIKRIPSNLMCSTPKEGPVNKLQKTPARFFTINTIKPPHKPRVSWRK